MFFIGDSIVAADNKPFNYTNISYNEDKLRQIGRSYPTLLEEKLGVEVVENTAVGGHTITKQK